MRRLPAGALQGPARGEFRHIGRRRTGRADRARGAPACSGPGRGRERTRQGPLIMEFLIANLAPVMFATLVVFLLLGFPVAFALAANGILYGLVGIELGLLSPALFQALPQRVFGIISNDTLLAVPFF